MAVKIRLQRGGAKHKPVYRMVVADSRCKRDGRFIEIVGAYDPKNKIEGRQVRIKLDRTEYWMSVGAQPSDTARTIINRAVREAEARAEAEGAEAKPAATQAAPQVAEGDAAAAAGEGSDTGSQPAGVAAEKEAREVANQPAVESSATSTPPQEAKEAAGEDEEKKA